MQLEGERGAAGGEVRLSLIEQADDVRVHLGLRYDGGGLAAAGYRGDGDRQAEVVADERLPEEQVRLHGLHVPADRFLLRGGQALELVGGGENAFARADAAVRRTEAELDAEPARLERPDEVAVHGARLRRIEVIDLASEDAGGLCIRAGESANRDQHSLRGGRDRRGRRVVGELIDAGVVRVEDLNALASEDQR